LLNEKVYIQTIIAVYKKYTVDIYFIIHAQLYVIKSIKESLIVKNLARRKNKFYLLASFTYSLLLTTDTLGIRE